MTSKTSSSRRTARRFHPRAAMLALAIASAAIACSVYDESLRQGASLAPAEGGNSADAGGNAGTLASGGTDSAAGADAIDAGAPGNGGDSGEPAKGGSSNGGHAGNASAGRAGSASSGGNGGSDGNGGSGGRVVAMGGSAGTAISGGNGGTAASSGGSAGMSGSVGTAGTATELALGKPTTASTAQPANPASSGNDGQTATRFSVTSATLPQWWRVDLGASHALTQVAIQFEFPDRKYTYAVETSADDSTYTTQATVVDGVGTVQTVPIPNHASARYVRITCTATVPGVDSTGTSRPTWMSFWEASVRGN